MARKNKVPEDAIMLRIHGAGVKPAAVDVRDVAKFLSWMDDLARSATAMPKEAFALSLTKVKSSSMTLVFGGSPPARDTVGGVVGGLVEGKAAFNEGVMAPLVSIVDMAEAHNWKASLTAGGKTADLTGAHRPTPRAAPRIEVPLLGTTTIYGVIYGVRLKGTEGEVIVRPVDTKRTAQWPCSAADAKKLGQHLGVEVALSGEAEWHGPTLELVKFRVTSFEVPDVLSASAFFDGLAALGPIRLDDGDDDDDDDEDELVAVASERVPQ